MSLRVDNPIQTSAMRHHLPVAPLGALIDACHTAASVETHVSRVAGCWSLAPSADVSDSLGSVLPAVASELEALPRISASRR